MAAVARRRAPRSKPTCRNTTSFDKLDREHLDALLHGCIGEAAELDAMLARHVDRKTSLLSPVEHAVLLIGSYELKHCIEIPYRVVINEGVELAKSFGGTDGHKFVNGVLDKAAAELRPVEVDRRPGFARGARHVIRLASRLDHIEPFYVMECAKAAEAIARSPACDAALGGEPMIFLNIGEPDFHAPPPWCAPPKPACTAAGRSTPQATGLPALREKISAWYASRFGLQIDAGRIVITAGASAALQLATLALFERRRRGADARPQLPLQPPFRRRCRRAGQAAAGRRRGTLPARRGDGARALERTHPRRAAGIAFEPHRHIDRTRRDGGHRRLGARAWRCHPGRRDLSRR